MSYPSDLTPTQWQCIEKIVETEVLDRKRAHSLGAIINAIFYVSKSGIQWRMMLSDLPPWQTVYSYYRKWRLNGLWQWLHDCLHKKSAA